MTKFEHGSERQTSEANISAARRDDLSCSWIYEEPGRSEKFQAWLDSLEPKRKSRWRYSRGGQPPVYPIDSDL